VPATKLAGVDEFPKHPLIIDRKLAAAGVFGRLLRPPGLQVVIRSPSMETFESAENVLLNSLKAIKLSEIGSMQSEKHQNQDLLFYRFALGIS
jgi:hypothetical protein